MNPMNTLVKALLTGFGWRLGSEVAKAISDKVSTRGSGSSSAATADDDDEDEPGDANR
jgi:hypothetical protein